MCGRVAQWTKKVHCHAQGLNQGQTDHGRKQTAYVYNADGSVAEVRVSEVGVSGDDRVTQYVYDGLGRTIQTIMPDPVTGVGGPTYSTVYDAVGHVLQSIDPLGNVTTYEYNGFGQMTKQTAPDADGVLGGGDQPITEYVYDLAGQLVQLRAPGPNGPRLTSYQYDFLGRQTATLGPYPDVTGDNIVDDSQKYQKNTGDTILVMVK
jgi:YD repeat-containing protein